VRYLRAVHPGATVESVSDHGIDTELELRNDDGSASGQKLCLVLEPRASCLQDRGHDGTSVFRITEPEHADYWADQAFPVMLVVRGPSGEIEWAEIGQPLRRQRDGGERPARGLVFAGERFDLMSIRRWRDKTLSAH
jgi:hypothetical protein